MAATQRAEADRWLANHGLTHGSKTATLRASRLPLDEWVLPMPALGGRAVGLISLERMCGKTHFYIQRSRVRQSQDFSDEVSPLSTKYWI